MNRDEIQKLLGGYATGTLTPEEQQALFEAALDDQELFDELAREQALRDLLRDPAARAHLLTALDSKPPGWWARWWRPAAAAMVMAGVVVLAVVVVRNSAPKPVIVAVTKPQAPLAPIEKERDSGGARSVAEPMTVPAAPRVVRAPADRDTRRGLKDAAADKLTREAPAAALPTAPPPPPPVEKRAEAASDKAAQSVAPVKTEVVQAKDQVSLNSAVTVLADAKLAAGAKALFLRSQAVFFGGAGGSSSLVESRQVAAQEAESFAQQQRLQRPPQSPSPSMQQGQQGAQQSAPSRAKQANIQSATGAIVAATQPQLGVRYTVAPGLGLLFRTNAPTAVDSTAVRIETNTNGYLYAWARTEGGEWRPVMTLSAVRMQPITTPALRPGEKEMVVLFSREPRSDQSGPASADTGTNLIEKDGAFTYVVNPLTGIAGRQLQFTIRLP